MPKSIFKYILSKKQPLYCLPWTLLLHRSNGVCREEDMPRGSPLPISIMPSVLREPYVESEKELF